LQNYNTDRSGTLDKLRHLSGSQALKAYFIKLSQENRVKAVAQINYSGLRFTTFFILIPEIYSLNLYSELSPRNQTALKFCVLILNDQSPYFDGNRQYSNNDDLTLSALKWIFNTGIRDDGLNNEFDQILDVAASHLIRTYHHTAILQELVRFIFKRNRKGRYIHDLVWALWGSCDPHILMWIADYLRSTNKKDAELANRLLKNTPLEDDDMGARKPLRYEQYLSWFKENQPYLIFTEESFHQTSDPALCSVDLAAKYRCKKKLPQERRPFCPATETEYNGPEPFSEKEYTERLLLAKYSHRLHGKSIRQWKKWMEYPIEKQLEIARNGLGGAF
jgi:hypothetical protein